jgi:hypothetical protein
MLKTHQRKDSETACSLVFWSAGLTTDDFGSKVTGASIASPDQSGKKIQYP